MIVVPFQPEHCAQIAAQDAQAYMGAEFARPEYGQALFEQGPARTGMRDGRIVACAGILPQWEGRAIAWAILALDAGRCMHSLHREVLAFLDGADVRRIETTVDCQFRAGHRWASMLGFVAEGRMNAYTPDGRDVYLYARVR